MPFRADHEERTKVITLQEVEEMKGLSHVVISMFLWIMTLNDR